MKIRNGYVSNSSSSSFIVIGKSIGNILDGNLPMELDFKNHQYAMIGKFLSGDDADDFIHLNKEIYEWLLDRRYDTDVGNGEIIEIIKSGENNWGSDCMKIPDNCSGAYVWNIHASDNSSKNVEDLERHYFNAW